VPRARGKPMPSVRVAYVSSVQRLVAAFLRPLGGELLKGISLKASWRTDGTRSSPVPPTTRRLSR
jgi:hypothetical protein